MVSKTTDIGDGMELVDGDGAASSNAIAVAQSIDPDANIIKRMWRAELDIGKVEKSQLATVKTEAGSYTYKFSGHDLIMAAVRPALARHGIKHLPTVTKHERVGNLTILTVAVAFINVDDPTDQITVEMVNYGADKGDKGASKALTNCVREALKKALGITSIDDGRADETTEAETENVGRKELETAKEDRRAAIQQWAATFKAALENAKDADGVARLQRDNRDQLASDDLPTVTRTFFVELIEKRKADLA